MLLEVNGTFSLIFMTDIHSLKYSEILYIKKHIHIMINGLYMLLTGREVRIGKTVPLVFSTASGLGPSDIVHNARSGNIGPLCLLFNRFLFSGLKIFQNTHALHSSKLRKRRLDVSPVSQFVGCFDCSFMVLRNHRSLLCALDLTDERPMLCTFYI